MLYDKLQVSADEVIVIGDSTSEGDYCKNIQRKKRAQQQAVLDGRPDWRLKGIVPNNTRDVLHFMTSQLTTREQGIVQHDATSLVGSIRNRLYTAVEVATAFCKVATVAHELTNCLTEIFFEEGLRRAAELDKHLAETGQVVGPLHGLPVSIKDHIRVKGLDTSAGYLAWAFKSYATHDALSVEILRRAGAVFYVKTANPQTLLSLETNNNVFGRTVNPNNRTLTPGGSSGGESVLIASHGSPLGIGTDIGGSVRVPAAHMGLYGFKPSVSRLPHGGLNGSHDGMEAIIGALGPLATSSRDLSLFCKIMLDYQPWLVEPSLIEIPWKQDVVDGRGIPSKLSFAVIWDDGVVAPHPPILKALLQAKEALVSAGHEVIDWECVNHQEAWDLITKLYFLDGGKEYRSTMANDPEVSQTAWIMSQVPNGGRPFTVGETFRLNAARDAFRAKMACHWNETKSRTSTRRHVDAILCPVSPTLAPPHDTTRWWGYSSYWNLLDYPGVVFPVGRYHAQEWSAYSDVLHKKTPRNETERFISAQWNRDTYDNAAISLQLVGRRLNEEYLLGVFNAVEHVICKA